MNKKRRNPVLLYFIMIPFLHPRGFDEYFTYISLFFKVWQYLAIAIIAFLVLMNIKTIRIHKNGYIFSMLLYFITMLVLTVIIRKTLSETIQKIFVAPFVCIYTYLELKKNAKGYIKCVNNINCFNLILNSSLFSPLLWRSYFNPNVNQLIFLGHIQVCAQVGILSFLFTYLEYYLYPDRHKRRYIVLFLVSLVSMLTSQTSASYIAIGLICLFYIIDKTKLRKVFTYSCKFYLLCFLLLNLAFMYIVSKVNVEISIGPLSMSGRGFIWIESLKQIAKNPIWGYGVHGVNVVVFWHQWLNDSLGMNYMHNQVLQVLSDGGIILFFPYIFMLYNSMKNIDKVKDIRLRFWSVMSILVILIIMVFESSLEYVYGHIALATFSVIPLLSNTPTMRIKKKISV